MPSSPSVRNLLDTALARVKQKVSPKRYQIFHLHVCKKMTASQVARRLDLKLAEVYYAKYTVSRLLRKEIKLLNR